MNAKTMKTWTRGLPGIVLLGASVFAVAKDAHAAEYNHSCTISDITVLSNRVHVRCSNGAYNGSTNSIFYFAVSNSSPSVDRYLSVATTALVSQKTFQIRYDTVYGPGGFGTVGDCGSVNCRVPVSFSIK